MEQANLEMNPPEDKFYLVYFTLLLHGIGTLLPWNMFITARAVSTHHIINSFEIIQ